MLRSVTILILVDGFLQYALGEQKNLLIKGHNPYFSRWFSAITTISNKKGLLSSHNPYFSRWFSAM